MKKIFKKSLVILFAALLFLSPVSTAYAATSAPVLLYSYDTGVETFKWFEFQPDPYFLTPGNGVILQDTTNNQQWSVLAGRTFTFQINLAQGGSFDVLIYRLESSPQLVHSETVTGYSNFYLKTFNPISYNANYMVVIRAANTDISVQSYSGSTY
ncbi:MAG: hypothetical protein K0R92_368 [Lachnospiraceae bacterium]|jgi:hypothetical protein|nr:hypothetical protein [Lachnospiraceae bacterium]